MSDYDSQRSLPAFVTAMIEDLRERKDPETIAREANLRDVTTLAKIAAGTVKLPIDKVRDLAGSLECDPQNLMRLALEQFFKPDEVNLILETGAGRAWKDLEEAASLLTAISTRMRLALEGLGKTASAAGEVAREVENDLDRLNGLRIDVDEWSAKFGGPHGLYRY